MSLVKFCSPTQGSVVMFSDDAKELLAALNQAESGEMMTADLPRLITSLRKIIAVDKNTNPVIWPDELPAEEDTHTPIVIHLSQRAVPLLKLMERCLSATETIRWPA